MRRHHNRAAAQAVYPNDLCVEKMGSKGKPFRSYCVFQECGLILILMMIYEANDVYVLEPLDDIFL